ncbi:MAG: hypothetical protein PHU25_11095 [Deltaproteobacteria bacterium]|nr:hypothetical protein [Deltaproteobacteria bacterium]
MANAKPPHLRASETVTFRLTLDDRRLIEHVAQLEGKTLTDLVRGLVSARAGALGVREVPERAARRRPGRPKTVKAPVAANEGTGQTSRTSQTDWTEDRPSMIPAMPDRRVTTFGDLSALFTERFSDRAEGTQRELADTIALLASDAHGAPLIASGTPLRELTSARLHMVRESVDSMDLRLTRKNLIMSHLRMMMHFAVKQPEVALDVNPALDLGPFAKGEDSG